MKANKESYALRSTGEQIGSEVNDCFELDGVEFISRAFADEILAQALENDFVIDVTEANEDVQKMILIVMKSREKGNVSNPTVEGLESVEVDLS